MSFAVRAGEIVGIAGVQGNGQTELVEAVTGMRRVAGGKLNFTGKDITRASTRTCHRLGMAHIPEDRRRSGMIGEFTVAENMVLNSYYDSRYASGIALRWPDVYAASAHNVVAFDVRTPSIFEPTEHLSGGNQQKLVVARELSRQVKLVVAAQPTRGLDVGSVDYVHDRLVEARRRRGRPHGVDRARRDPGAVRPHPGDVQGTHRQGVRARRQRGRDRPGNGGSGLVTDTATRTTASEDLLKRAVAQRFDAREVIVLPVLAVLIALLIGGAVMLVTGVAPEAIVQSYLALFSGSLGSLYAVSETLTAAAPLTLAALGLAVGFKAGLFNIGAEGQMIIGGVAAVVVGFSLPGLPIYLHLPLALIAGALGGALWASIAGWLRAATGAHEVILTIMLNLTAMRLLTYLLRNPPIQNPERTDPISKSVLDSARLPDLLDWIDPALRLHGGILIAVGAALLVYWLLYRSTVGFEFAPAAPIGRRALCRHPCRLRHRRGDGLLGRSRALPGPTRCWASSAACRRTSRAASASMRSRWRCSAAPIPRACSSPGCCSARCRPAGGRCRSPPG